MKNIVYAIIILLAFAECSKQQSASEKLLDEVEKIIEINPDSASTLLGNVSSPETLDDRSFARWCMLSDKITDKIHTPILPTYHLERAYKYFLSEGYEEEQAQILLYLGRSYAEDGDYDQAMTIYTKALEVAEKNTFKNLTGYINCYIGDLYEEKGMFEQANTKYKLGAKHFRLAQNFDSYACALRDIGREYAGMDSLSQALKVMFMADSIANMSKNIAIKASILNGIGNIYLIQQKYDKAKPYYHKALLHGTNIMPNYIALVQMYIETDSLAKARDILQTLPQENPEYAYSINNLYHLIHKKEKKYDLALNNMEECLILLDSIVRAENQMNILNIEKKYNNLKHREKINDLTISRQKYIIISILCILSILAVLAVYLWYRKKIAADIHKQQIELSNVKLQLVHLSIELEKKQQKLSTLEEKNEEYNKMKEEIASVISNYKKLQNKLISDSPIYKNLAHLANQNIPGTNKSLITEKQWLLIEKEITSIYPNLYSYILDICPELSDQEWKYCCFCMFGFDITSEAKLLNINPTSVSTKRLRLKQKLNIMVPAKMPFYEYIALKLM